MRTRLLPLVVAAIPSALLVTVAGTHYGYDLIASTYDAAVQLRAAKAWHHMLRAIEASVLYVAVWVLMPWRPIALRLATVAVCTWGLAESVQIAACRLRFPMDEPPPDTKLFTGLCDAATGYPLYMLALIGAMVALSAIVGQRETKDD